jgi:phospho-N-acetylmuramoyl-pentapeptide-transferase
VVAVSFAVLALQFVDERGNAPASTNLSFIRDTVLGLGPVLFVIFAYLMIAGASNGVNLTDGLDGLATGASVMVFGSYVLIGIWQFGQSCAINTTAQFKCYEVRDPLDLAVVARAMGACFGFRGGTRRRPGSSWVIPARWRRGASAGITTRTELLLPCSAGCSRSSRHR